MPNPDRSRRLLVPLTVAAFGLAGIFVAEDLPVRHSIESQLTDRSMKALNSAGVTGVAVRFDGRDGRVSVLSADQADKARTIVAGQEGVRVATVEVVSALPGTKPTVMATISPSPTASPSESASSGPSPSPSSSPAAAAAPPSATDLQRQLQSTGRIEFASGSAVLDGDSDRTLAQIAAILAANPNVQVRIEGNTDSTGDARVNQVLSAARAIAVKDALVKLGIDAGRMTTIGYGESRPLVPNTSADNRARNRRVAFDIFE